MVSIDEGFLNFSIRLGTRLNQLVRIFLLLNSLKQCPRNVYLLLIYSLNYILVLNKILAMFRSLDLPLMLRK